MPGAPRGIFNHKEFPVNKAQLIKNMADDAGLSVAGAERALESAIAHITRTIRKGDSVTLVGFGTFKAVSRKAREGRNPRTGLPAMIAAHRAPVFKASPMLKARLN